MTPATYKEVLCPLLKASPNKGLGTCLGTACALWRWRDPPPLQRKPERYYADSENPNLLAKGEPPRPERALPHWMWVPIVQDGEDEEGPTYTGGYWQEPPQPIEADNAAKRAARRAYCGLGPKPEPFP